MYKSGPGRNTIEREEILWKINILFLRIYQYRPTAKIANVWNINSLKNVVHYFWSDPDILE